MPTPIEEVEAEQKRSNKSTWFDKFVLVVATVEPLSTFPQVYEVWFKHQTAGVSALTWFLYALSESIWLAYGIYKRDKPVIAASIMWILVEGLVAVGALVK